MNTIRHYDDEISGYAAEYENRLEFYEDHPIIGGGLVLFTIASLGYCAYQGISSVVEFVKDRKTRKEVLKKEAES